MLSKLSVKKPFTVIVGIIIVIILGVVSYLNMGVDLLPEMNLPYVAVVTISPGSPPEEVEKQVTRPVEDTLSTVANIDEMTSMSYEHFSLVLLEFNYDADIDRAYADVNAALDLVTLPDNELMQDPIVLRINPALLPVMSVSISQEDRSIKESNAYLSGIIEQINALEGVATVTENGLITNMAYINVNDEKIASSLFDFLENLIGFELALPIVVKEEIRSALAESIDMEEMTSESIIETIVETLKDAQQWDDSVEDNVLKTITDILIVSLEDPDSFVYQRVEESVEEIISNKFILNEDNESKKVFYDFIDQITKTIIIEAVNEQIGDLTSMISPDILGQLLYAQDFEMPSGSLQDGAVSYIVKIGTTVDSRDELIDLPVISFDLSAEISTRLEQVKTVLTLLSVASEGEVVFTQSQFEELSQAIYEVYSGGQEYTSPLTEAFAQLLEEIDAETYESLEDLFAERSPEDIENYLRSFLSVLSLFSPQGVIIPEANGEIDPNAEYIIDFVAIQQSLLALEDSAVIPLTLGSLADITFLDDSIDRITTLLTRVDGELVSGDAVNITIDKEPDKSTAEVTRGVQEFLTSVQEEDDSFRYTVLYNDGDYIDFMLNNVIKNLIYGGLLAVFILFLFLRNIKATIVVGSSIVISVVATFVMMYFANVTLNVVSMGGLALGVGMLVDNSIVIIENIFRMRAQGKNIFVASIQGAKQVTAAIVASTLTTVIVFLPIAFIEGLTKQIFTDMALTITFSLLASLIVALTLVPMSTSTFIKKPAKNDSKIFMKIKKGYAKSLNFALNHKIVPIVIVAVMFVGSILMLLNMDNELFPEADSGTLSITATIDRVAIDRYNAEKPIDEPYLTYEDVEERIIEEIINETKNYEEIQSVGISFAGGLELAGFSLGDNNISASIMLVDEKERDFGSLALIDMMKENIGDYNNTEGLYSLSFSGNDVMGGMDIMGGDQTIKLFGRDLDLMRQEAQKIKDLLSQKDNQGNIVTDQRGDPIFMEGVSSVTVGNESTAEEYRIKVDKEKANRYGLTVAQVFLQIQSALSEAGVSHTLNLLNDNNTTTEYDVYIYTSDFKVNSWYVCENQEGADVPVYILNNRESEDDAAENDYYIRNPYNKGVYVKRKNENIYIAEGGRIPLTYQDDTFSYFLINEGETGLMYTQKTFTKTSNSLHYKIDRVKEFDIMTMGISSESLLDPESPTVVVPLYRLLDDECFLRDDEGNILYRENLVERIPVGLITSDGYNTINRENRQRVETISIKFDKEASSSEMIELINSIIEEDYEAPQGILLDMSEGNKYIDEVFNTLYMVLILAIVLIYLVMVAQFQSLKSPLIIMITLPLAFTGSIVALFLSNLSLSVMAMIGLIVLMGIVVNNGIVFVDYCNQMIQSNVPKRMALLRTGIDRLRPILMTALTTIFALIIMATDFSEGGVMLRPLAIAAIGGLVFSTFLTLYFVPMFYDIINKKAKQTDRHKAFLDKDIDMISTTEVEDMLKQTADNRILNDVVSSSDLGEAVANINKDIEDLKPRDKQPRSSERGSGLKYSRGELRYQKIARASKKKK